MPDTKKEFKAGEYFAWGTSIHRANENCQVTSDQLSGDASEILRFEDECLHSEAVLIVSALKADRTFADPNYGGEEVDDAEV